MGAWGAYKMKFLNNKVFFSNWKLNSPGWDASALKVLHTVDGLYEGNEVAYNASLGIWLDQRIQGFKIKNNIVHDNLRPGLEDEANFGNSWEGNVVYRNEVGFYCGNSANDIIKNNIFADNFQGFYFRFSRSRVSDLNNPKKMDDMRKVNKYIGKIKEWSSSEARVQRWFEGYKKYFLPCHAVKDNLIEKNIFINNKYEVITAWLKIFPT